MYVPYERTSVRRMSEISPQRRSGEAEKRRSGEAENFARPA
ncbi:hypothetical protein HMPREF0860_2044 [Treponema socranskii subsp. socranskii VPI DR56BR1116 = ATCC 35536]|uniref:Uncharacterized protein n=1 Tax=Treponema socranskii subsp. socranskii VPI DR56BR1116 = ATCC 35536 TaxID=1125725 RepID=U2KY50_TRESO|nr:hypothetical protein HMPREF1325_0490 [Treponema socranskii subsp. socranskii VPI DR56BR1116 = ATCC 35536]ERK03387.1 hypothetical protein HMPREF0860_2044 [Treponema socranskii subsp. socranskii VPI DR56BR1116 = ATCC 35536]